MSKLTLIERQKRAYELHAQIAQSGKKAVESYFELGYALKEINEYRFFRELGYDTFESYVEIEWHFKHDMAYKYIQVIEKLPKQIVERVTQSGIDSLSLRRLIALPSDPNYFQNLSETELKELSKMTDAEFNKEVRAWKARYQKAYRDKEHLEAEILTIKSEKTALIQKIESLNNEIFTLKTKEDNEKLLIITQERDNLRNQLFETQSKLAEKESIEMTEEQAIATIRKSLNQVLEAMINLRRVQLFESIFPQLYGTYSLIRDMLDAQVAYLVDKFDPSTGPLTLKHIVKDSTDSKPSQPK